LNVPADPLSAEMDLMRPIEPSRFGIANATDATTKNITIYLQLLIEPPFLSESHNNLVD